MMRARAHAAGNGEPLKLAKPATQTFYQLATFQRNLILVTFRSNVASEGNCLRRPVSSHLCGLATGT